MLKISTQTRLVGAAPKNSYLKWTACHDLLERRQQYPYALVVVESARKKNAQVSCILPRDFADGILGRVEDGGR